jgi:hypothetical protein
MCKRRAAIRLLGKAEVRRRRRKLPLDERCVHIYATGAIRHMAGINRLHGRIDASSEPRRQQIHARSASGSGAIRAGAEQLLPSRLQVAHDAAARAASG